MALFKCKMCGGALEINNNETVATCEYCGTQQTLPKLDNDRRANLYDRANHFRRNNDFDKAMGIYEQILNEDNSDAEAYWSLVLCRYGIEYVEDPTSHKRIPTVNRAQFTSIFDDDNYKSALQYADGYQKSIYEEEAKAINEIQKGILAISQKEEPFDVFICYKETDSNGRRTPDSVLANDLYHQLTQEGFKVFFARITLEDKLGSAYEPYIFAALNSAKVMVVLGTKPEYFNAVWVKNEWSRYLALIKNGAKKMLIPAYKDIDPYDLPEEFSHLQAQDMSKLGFMQDLIRGIKKIAQADAPKTTVVKETVVTGGNANIAPLLKRAFMFLEDKEFGSANEYCEKVLDADPECAEAYLGKLMVELKVSSRGDLKNREKPFDNYKNYEKAMRFADDSLREELQGYINHIVNRNLTVAYNKAMETMRNATTDAQYRFAASCFAELDGFKDSWARIEECYAKAEEYKEAAKLESYNGVVAAMSSASEDAGAFKQLAENFVSFGSYMDAEALAAKCYAKAEEIEAKERAEAIESAYNAAVNDMALAKNDRACLKVAEAFESLGEYKDSVELAEKCHAKAKMLHREAEEARKLKEYEETVSAMNSAKSAKEFALAAGKFSALGEYKASKEYEATCYARAEVIRKKTKKLAIIAGAACAVIIVLVTLLNNVIIPNSKYNNAVELMGEGKYEEAIAAFEALGGYKDSLVKIDECNVAMQEANELASLEARYNDAMKLMDEGKYEEAITAFNALGGYKDSSEKANSLYEIYCNDIYNSAVSLMREGKNAEAMFIFADMLDYKDSKDLAAELWSTYNPQKIAGGYLHSVGLKADGTVVAVGNNEDKQCEVSDWNNIVAIAAGNSHTVGLRADGTVVAVGNDSSDQCKVSDWSNIVAIAAGEFHTVGLRADGTVVAVGYNKHSQCEVSDWSNIVAIAAGKFHTVGLRADGTVVAVGNDSSDQCKVSDWSNIVAIAAGHSHTVGLRADGTVVAVGYNEYSQCEVSDWSNIVAIAAGEFHTVGLRADGTVVAVGNDSYDQCKVSDWSDIVAVSAGYYHTIGLKADGTVVAVGDSDLGECDVSGWSNIAVPTSK